MTSFSKETDILARTIYGEARGLYAKSDGGLSALISIANVVMNRVAGKTWFGSTVTEVCLKPYQFSCWNKNDPNRPVIEKITESSALFTTCLTIADKAIKKDWPDLTKGSDHYYACWLKPAPIWAAGQSMRIKISEHLFFRLTKEI